ncbi:hypothetical protein AAC387_Pa05g1880 [Persea americana]
MLRSQISPDNFTFPFQIRSCSISSLLDLGRQVHAHFFKFVLDFDVFVINNAIAMYSNCEELGSARQVFDECSGIADVVLWTALVTGPLSKSSQASGEDGYLDFSQLILIFLKNARSEQFITPERSLLQILEVWI